MFLTKCYDYLCTDIPLSVHILKDSLCTEIPLNVPTKKQVQLTSHKHTEYSLKLRHTVGFLITKKSIRIPSTVIPSIPSNASRFHKLRTITIWPFHKMNTEMVHVHSTRTNLTICHTTHHRCRATRVLNYITNL
jgi:hypothetical protein